MTEIGLNRRMVRALYPGVDWDEYDREVVTESAPPRPPECPTCDDEWAAHVAGLHEEPQA